MTTIWSTGATPVTGTIRIPADTASNGTPAHITGNDLLNYIEANYNLTSDLVGTGTDSILIDGTTADVTGAIAIGKNSVASGSAADDLYPIAIGHTATAEQQASIAIGYQATAGSAADENDESSVAIGQNAQSTNRHTVALGRNAAATGTNGIAIGDDSSATNTKTVALGNTAIASADRGIAIGSNAEANHSNSIAMGELVTSDAVNQFKFGELLLRLGSFNVAGLPSAASYTGHIAYVSNGDAGLPCLAVSNGTSWLRIALGSAVSAS